MVLADKRGPKIEDPRHQLSERESRVNDHSKLTRRVELGPLTFADPIASSLTEPCGISTVRSVGNASKGGASDGRSESRNDIPNGAR